MKGILIIFFSFSLILTNYSQTTVDNSKKIETLNKYVDFMNANIHGMTVIKVLLENFNQEINKYVDLESFKLNDINEYVSYDVFKEVEYYAGFNNNTPYELLKLYNISANNLDVADRELLRTNSERLLEIISATNKVRHDASKLIKTLDLNDIENVNKVYKELEIGVKLFNEFYRVEKEVEKVIISAGLKYESKSEKSYNELSELKSLSRLCKNILTKIREKEENGIDNNIEQLLVQIEKCKNLKIEKVSNLAGDNSVGDNLKDVLERCTHISKMGKQYLNNESIPQRFKAYGRTFYYYNEMNTVYNFIGGSTVFNVNNLIKLNSRSIVQQIEMPTIFQIIYPKKIESGEVIKATDTNVFIPVKVKERTVTKNKVMRVDGPVVTLQLYDHMIQDGDVVSINFNGDWILEKEELEKGSKTVKIKLNEEGKNFLLLHAESVGKRPPNTMALSYMYKGDKKEIILKSDLNTSELIEIIQVKN